MFVARYKTGIAALSITRRRGSRMALEAIGSIRTAARGIVLSYNFVVTFCILPAPLAGRRGAAAPNPPGTAPPLTRFHYTVICQRKKALCHTIRNIAAKMQTSLAHPRPAAPGVWPK